MNMESENKNWLVNPKGAEEGNATLICTFLMSGTFGINFSSELNWQESGLLCKQDTKSKKWGIICNKPEMERQFRKRYKTQEDLDDLWNHEQLSVLIPNISKTEKVVAFIDGANTYAAAKNLGFDIDYSKLRQKLSESCSLIDIRYYTALIKGSDLEKLVDWLSYNGFTVVKKPAKTFHNSFGKEKTKGNMDIELALDAIQLSSFMDHMVLFSGDGDFKSLVETLKLQGVKVTVMSTRKTSPPMVADELRRACNQFVDIADMYDIRR